MEENQMGGMGMALEIQMAGTGTALESQMAGTGMALEPRMVDKVVGFRRLGKGQAQELCLREAEEHKEELHLSRRGRA